MDVIILSGGKGTRMEDSLPKAMIPVKGKPIISHQIDYFLKQKETEKIILSLGYKSDIVVDYINKNYPDENIEFSLDPPDGEPLGTGGAIKKALKLVATDKVIVLNADDITNINISELLKSKENTICAAHPRLPFGIIHETESYAQFEEKPMLMDLWVSCGWYIFNREEILKHLPDKGSIEYDTFPNIKLKIYNHEGFWMALNAKKDILEFEAIELPKELA